MAPWWYVGWGAAGVSAPFPMTRHPGVAPGAAPGSSPGPGCVLVAALHSAPTVHSAPLGEAPQSSVDNPTRLVYMVDSGPHHRSPCRCA